MGCCVRGCYDGVGYEEGGGGREGREGGFDVEFRMVTGLKFRWRIPGRDGEESDMG